MKGKFSTLFAILLTISAYCTKAEVRFISSRNGLSNSSVTCIYKDSEDYIWLGTWDGLNRYDGTEFRIFRPSLEENSLSGSVVRQIMEDTEGRLWVATDRGIDRFDRRTQTFTRHLSEAAKNGVIAEKSFFLTQDRDGRLFAGVSGHGLYEYDEETDSFAIVFTDRRILSGLFCDSSSGIWALSESRLYKIRESVDGTRFPSETFSGHEIEFAAIGQGGKMLWLKCSGENILRGVDTESGNETECVKLLPGNGELTCLYEAGGAIMIGTHNGAMEYKNGRLENLLPDRTPVLSLYEDSVGIRWIGTDMRGVAMISSSKTPFHSLTDKDIPFLQNTAVRAFFEELPGHLWVGTKGNGLALLDTDNGNVERCISSANGLDNDNVYSLGEGDEVIWVGTDGKSLDYIDKHSGKVYSLATPEEITIRSEYAILQTKRNVIWVGTSGHGLYRLEIDRTQHPYRLVSYMQFTKGNGLESNIVYALAQSAGEVWAATRGGGPARFSLEGEPLETGIGEEYGAALNDMTCLCAGGDGSVWMGTSLGIYRRTPEGNVEKIETRYINGTSVHGIVEDTHGILWVSTNNGLVRISRNSKPASETRFSVEDGLQDNEFSDGACYISPYSGKILFGGISGFTCFNPDDMGGSKIFPKLNIEGVYIDNNLVTECLQDENGHTRIVISPEKKSFTLKFATMDYISADRCELAYRLNGYSEDWVYMGTSKNIAFSNLPDGEYRLDVRYTNADKVWNDEIYSIDLQILPHWYETTGAIVSFWSMLLLVITSTIWSFTARAKERRKIREEEEEKNRIIDIHEAKLRFFTNIAHEFSNSLTLIYGPCKELQKMNSMPANSRKYLEYIENNSSRMLSLIQQIISFRRAETGHLNIRPEEIDVNGLISKEEEYFKGKFEEKGMKLDTVLPEEKILWVTDRDSLEKILFNLLSNATKYTPNGGTVKISCEVSGGKLKTSVTNYGTGIPEEKREAIFNRFEVLDRFESDIRKGKISNGIGLSMCRNLVELMEGRIWIDSDGQTFTSFCFELPMLEAAEGNAAPESHQSTLAEMEEAEGGLEGQVPDEENGDETQMKRVLVVDDDSGIRNFIRSLLSDKYKISEASNGEDALKEIKAQRPDLVISDVVMPKMDGFQLLKSVRGNEVFKHIPVVLLTSGNSDDNRKLGLDRGADAFIGKPFDPEILISTVTNLLGRDEAVRDYSSSAYSALDTFRGVEISKEDKTLLIGLTNVIIKNIDSDALCMDFVAEQLGVSKMYLYRKVKGNLGLTPIEYIKTLRLEKAEKLLKSTSGTVQQIMFDCGFNSKTYFYRMFDKKFGTTPKQYREKHLNLKRQQQAH